MPTYRDISTKLSQNPLTDDLAPIIDEQAIVAACKNLILGKKFERPFKEYLTADIDSDLFELISSVTASSIKTKIETAIRQYEPRVETVRAEVRPLINDNGYDVIVYILPRRAIRPIRFQFFLTKVF